MFYTSKFLTRTLALITLALSISVQASHTARADEGADPDANYDRLDGTGASHKKVNVIEWEGNLEIHVYPAGSVKGLALTIDRATKNKPVMVIGYRFNENPKQQLIRRAIIDGISLSDNFKAYKDPSADGYDKFIITNNTLGGDFAAYKLEPKPTQLYPDAQTEVAAKALKAAADQRTPASNGGGYSPSSSDSRNTQSAQDKADLEDSGTIRPFMTRDSGGRGR